MVREDPRILVLMDLTHVYPHSLLCDLSRSYKMQYQRRSTADKSAVKCALESLMFNAELKGFYRTMLLCHCFVRAVTA